MLRMIEEAVAFLETKIERRPKVGMITGTGLGALTEKMEVQVRLPFSEIPHLPSSTLMGHKGTLVAGHLSGKSIMAMEGRYHIYEGFTPQEVTLPVRIMAALGTEYLLISSAAGGLNPAYRPGDLMLLTDHINLTGTNPLIGPNLNSFGPRFPDMSQVYREEVNAIALETAGDLGIPLRQGVYVGITGPSLETPAETRFLRRIGADAVGMSTVSEVIAAVHCGLRILGIVVITNVNNPDAMEDISLEAVIEMAEKRAQTLSLLWERIIERLPV
jgi:purine-nucleoside phosphorylase